MKGIGCSLCSNKIKSKKSLYSLEDFIIKANSVHNTKYDYSKSIYITSKDKITIICPVHGEFLQLAADHLRGCGCSKCYGNSLKAIDEFISQANIKHNNKYDYSKSIYVNSLTKTIIKCKLHGEFLQAPQDHLSGRGCPICRLSKGELLIYN